MPGAGVSKGRDSPWREFERYLHLNGTRPSSTHKRQWAQKGKYALRLRAVKSLWYSDFEQIQDHDRNRERESV